MVFFPNIPFAPGVPAIPRAPGALGAVIDLVITDALSLLGLGAAQEWGLFFNGAPAVVAESVVSFDFKKGSSITTAPTEDGAFESYNKVRRPFDVRLRFSTGGTPADRQALLDSVDAVCESLDLFDAVTPEATYENLNPIDYSYRRTASAGQGMIIVDMLCEQVRVTATSSFTSTSTGSTTTTSGGTSNVVGTVKFRDTPGSINQPQAASAAAQTNDGTVQPVAPTQSQSDAISSVLSSSMLPF